MLLRPNEVWCATRDASNAGRVKEVKLDILSRARVKVAVKRASLCCIATPLRLLVSVIKKEGHSLHMKMVTSSARWLREERTARRFSNCVRGNEPISTLPYKTYLVGGVKALEIVAQEATADRGRCERIREMTSSGRQGPALAATSEGRATTEE